MNREKQILKSAMSVKYCSETRYDFLDEDEIPLILSAMQELARERERETSISFLDWVYPKIAMKNKEGEWIVTTSSGLDFNETYTTDKLYSKYEEHLSQLK